MSASSHEVSSALDLEIMPSLVFFRIAFAHPPNMPQTDRQREWVHYTIDRAADKFAVGERGADEEALDALYGVDMFRLARAMYERHMNVVTAERLRRLRTDYDNCVAPAMQSLTLLSQHGHSEWVTFDPSDEDVDYGHSELTKIIDGTARVLLQTLVDDADHQLPQPDALGNDTFMRTLYGFWFGAAYYYLSRADDFAPASAVAPMPELPRMPEAA